MLDVTEALQVIGVNPDKSSLCERITAHEGQTLSYPGGKADSIYLIQSGSVELFDGPETEETVGERKVLGPGHFVGEMGFEKNIVTQLTIRTLEKTKLLRIDGEGLGKRLRESCGEAFQLKKLMGMGERLMFVC